MAGEHSSSDNNSEQNRIPFRQRFPRLTAILVMTGIFAGPQDAISEKKEPFIPKDIPDFVESGAKPQKVSTADILTPDEIDALLNPSEPVSQRTQYTAAERKTQRFMESKFTKLTGLSLEDVEPGSIRVEHSGDAAILKYTPVGSNLSKGLKFQSAAKAEEVAGHLNDLSNYRAEISQISHAHNLDEVAFTEQEADPISPISMRQNWAQMLREHAANADKKHNAGLNSGHDFNYAALAANEVMDVLELDHEELSYVTSLYGNLIVTLKDDREYYVMKSDYEALGITDFSGYSEDVAQVMNKNIYRVNNNMDVEDYDYGDDRPVPMVS